MRKFCILSSVAAFALSVSCQKQQTEEERNAEVERQVQQRLAAEHQAEEEQSLTQRAAELDAREKALAEKQAASPTAVPARTSVISEAQEMRDTSGNPATATYSTFYTNLEPLGVWRETSTYGYVWQPREAEQSRNWRPYTSGHWVYTDVGWTWISEEPFGWATYHYGRWTRLRNIGWVWVPGDEWAPAWVSWRKSDEYVGWAPLPPEARFDRHSGIHNWADNYYDIGPDQYCFVATREFGGQHVERAVVPAERNVAIVGQTTNVTNITYNNTTVVNQGPSYDELRTRSQQPIARLRLERQINMNINIDNPRPVVKGEVIEMQAPVIARAQPAERPRKVRETVTQAIGDHGWEAIADRQAAEKVRVKMKSEATPPPDAPPKTFVKPAQAGAGTRAFAPTSTSSPTPVPVATSPARARTVAQTPRPRRSAPAKLTETPKPSVTTTPTATPFRRNPPIATPTSAAALTPPPSPSAPAAATVAREKTPFATSTSSPYATPGVSASASAPQETREEKRGKRRRLLGVEEKSKAQESQPRGTAPMSSPTSPAPTATSTSTPAPHSTSAISPSSAERLTKKQMKKQKRERREASEAGESISPSPTVP